MQLSELVGQYNNVSARPEMTGTKGIQKLVSTLRDMKSGNIFEGTVNSIKGQKVTLGLPNGQEVTARMDGKVKLTVGQSMFFQVKANDGTQIAIRPYTVEGNSMNLTLMEALKAANIVVDGRNLSMVNSMMEEQMSINRDSLSQMARIVSNNPDIDVKTLVQMQKLELPITPQMASQFENYQMDKQAIGQALTDFMDTLPEALANGEWSAEQLQQTTADVINILTENLPEEIAMPALSPELGAGAAGDAALPDAGQMVQADAVPAEAGLPEEPEAAGMTVPPQEHGAAETPQEGAGVAGAGASGAGATDAANAANAAASPDGTAVSPDGKPVDDAIPVVDIAAGEASTAGMADEAAHAPKGAPTAGTSAGMQMPGTEAAGAAAQAQTADAPDPAVWKAGVTDFKGTAFAAQTGAAGEGVDYVVSDAPVIDEAFLRAELAEQPSFPAHTLGNLFDGEQLENLSTQMQSFPELLSDETLFSGGQLRPTDSSAALLNAVKEQLSLGGLEKESVLSLVSGKEFQTLLKDAMEQQWMMKPEEITQKDKIARLYEKVENQLNRLEDVIRATGQENEQVSNLASDIRNNVQFMDQINQAYTYVQIPLKMAGQNASGELYVYTNKKNLAEGKDELSAFLHLDMDHLGSTDVSVKLHGKNVSTNFYFDNDEAYALVQAHAPILEERLKAKGYNCSVKVANESKEVNFVDDFLKKDQPSAGMVHRYSFDMKA